MYYVLFKDDYGEWHLREFTSLEAARAYAMSIDDSRNPKITKEVY